MKILCEECDGKGTVLGIKYENGTPHGCKKPCGDCNGEGYTENETIEHDNEVLKEKADKWDEKETPREVCFNDYLEQMCPKCDGSATDESGRYKYNYCPNCGQKLSFPEEDK